MKEALILNRRILSNIVLRANKYALHINPLDSEI